MKERLCFVTHEAMTKWPPIIYPEHPIHKPVRDMLADFKQKHGGKIHFQYDPLCPVRMNCFWDTAERIGDDGVKFTTSSFKYSIESMLFEDDGTGHLQPKTTEQVTEDMRPLVDSLLTNRRPPVIEKWTDDYEPFLAEAVA